MVARSDAAKAATIVDKYAPNFKPTFGLILGSGLGSLADQVQDPIKVPYYELPGFPDCTVAGHHGQIVLGTLSGARVACLQGRTHFYEGTSPAAMKTMIRTLKLIGCDTLLITNASGSLRDNVTPGNLMLISDHINMQWLNPLAGPNDDDFGPRFFPLDNAYDPEIRNDLLAIARKLDIPLTEGIYMSVLGPNFETPAEIRAFRTLGADCVGMSTVPEVLIARHCDLKVAVVATITNFAAGMSNDSITHEHTLRYAKLGATHLSKLLLTFLQQHDQ